MKPKYELTDQSIDLGKGRKAFRIKALRDIDTNYCPVDEGELGGYVMSTENLSQEGGCWIFPNGVVYGEAQVTENAVVGSPGVARAKATVNERAKVRGDATVVPHTQDIIIGDDATIEGDATVHGGFIGGNARITDNACVYSCGRIEGDIVMDDEARVNNENTIITGKAHLTGEFDLLDEIKVKDPGVLNYAEGLLIIKNFHLTQAYLSASRRGFTVYYNKKEGRVLSEAFTKPLTLEELKEWSESTEVDKTLKDGISKVDGPRLKALYDLLSTQDI